MLAVACGHRNATLAQDHFEPIQEDHSAISEPRSRWQAYGLQNYVFTQNRVCYCAPPHTVDIVVQNGRVARVTSDAGEPVANYHPAMTLTQMFAWIDTLQQHKPARLEVEYDARFGFPARLQLDKSVQMADDELDLRITALRRLRK